MTDPMTTMFGPKRCLKCGRDHYPGACPEPPPPARTIVRSPSEASAGNPVADEQLSPTDRRGEVERALERWVTARKTVLTTSDQLTSTAFKAAFQALSDAEWALAALSPKQSEGEEI